MKPTATFETLKCFADARGLVLEPLGPAELPLQKNAHLVLTAPGGVRGNHYHRQGTEVMVLIGPALVRLRDGHSGEVRDVKVAPAEVVRFFLPPGVAHAIQNTGDQPLVILSFSDCAHDPQSPDVVREVLIPV
ncbi:MAG: cupin domain-containing protein [Verrucomicrobiales bacterium]|nr:cupin domain-containing protein [Verrucomicrobiales bacterium]